MSSLSCIVSGVCVGARLTLARFAACHRSVLFSLAAASASASASPMSGPLLFFAEVANTRRTWTFDDIKSFRSSDGVDYRLAWVITLRSTHRHFHSFIYRQVGDTAGLLANGWYQYDDQLSGGAITPADIGHYQVPFESCTCAYVRADIA